MSIEFARGNESDKQGVELALWREDEVGNRIRMPGVYTSYDAAEEAHDHFTKRGHKQTYYIEPIDHENDTTVITAEERRLRLSSFISTSLK
jgi:hypothetical protein